MTYRQFGDLPIKADVYYFNNNKPRPAIVSLHGGALIMGNRKGISRPVREFALTNGYVLVSFDYRLAPETKLPAIIDDIETAFKWLRRRRVLACVRHHRAVRVCELGRGRVVEAVVAVHITAGREPDRSVELARPQFERSVPRRAHIRGTIRAGSPPMKHGNKSKVRPSQTPANVKATAASSIIFAVKMALAKIRLRLGPAFTERKILSLHAR